MGAATWRIRLNDPCSALIRAVVATRLFERALRADNGYVPYFPICQETLPWQPNNVAIMKVN